MSRKYRWGILAPGKMSAKFTKALKMLRHVELHAVGSRDTVRAQRFADEFGFSRSYGSYEELAADKDVDIIYVASPHSFHYDHTMMCLRNNKAVLCEKAFALNSREANEMLEEAEKRKLFLMEALWPPFQPLYRKAREILESGEVGRLIHMNTKFAMQAPFVATDRKFNLELGGGSLLDIGIYCVIDALWFIGVPDEVVARATFSKTGSEDSVNVILGYNDGRTANIYSSFRTVGGIGCDLLCENGGIYFSRGRDMSQKLTVAVNGHEEKNYFFHPEAMGYHYEADEAMKCLDEGKVESDIVPHSFTRDLMTTLDRIRKSAGIVFPGRD